MQREAVERIEPEAGEELDARVELPYRLAETSDPVLAAIRDAVVRALGQADTVRKDAGRLYEKTGCCAPAMLQFVQRSARM